MRFTEKTKPIIQARESRGKPGKGKVKARETWGKLGKPRESGGKLGKAGESQGKLGKPGES
jgi:hypothetical protein